MRASTPLIADNATGGNSCGGSDAAGGDHGVAVSERAEPLARDERGRRSGGLQLQRFGAGRAQGEAQGPGERIGLWRLETVLDHLGFDRAAAAVLNLLDRHAPSGLAMTSALRLKRSRLLRGGSVRGN